MVPVKELFIAFCTIWSGNHDYKDRVCHEWRWSRSLAWIMWMVFMHIMEN